jgi:hypothetical protein
MSMPDIPPDVIEWICSLFRGCNERLSEKISNNPNLPEESLDLTWVEYLSQHASPLTLSSSWTIKIETHYLGGLRHFMRWEIADIGVLLFLRRAGRIEKSKVALLQSKRLYPLHNTVQEEDRVDYEIGFARLADPELLQHAVAIEAEFQFDETCAYGALLAKSDQVAAIAAYERKNQVAVYYQLYNPWRIPFIQRIPLTQFGRPKGVLELGTRIIPANSVHRLLRRFVAGRKPTLKDLMGVVDREHEYGWPLEHFISDLFLGCSEGTPFETISEERIQTLFYRRSGPISAAVAISIEAPE